MARKLDFGSARTQEPEQRYSQKCKAHDCPLVWTIPAGGHHEGLCTIHGNAEPSKWPRITQKILENRGIYDGYVRVMHMGAGEFDVKRNTFNHTSIPPEPKENGLAYKARLLNRFREVVTS